MLHWILSVALSLPAQEASARAQAPTQQPSAAAVAARLETELSALAREFAEARATYDKRLDELRKQGEAHPEAHVEHPAVAFWPRVAELAQRGSGGARLWMGLQFANAHPGPATPEREQAWREHLLAAVDAGANGPQARDLARCFTLLYLDTPPALADEALEQFVRRTTQRELAAEALFRGSIAQRRGVPGPASPKAAEFGKRLAAEYADTAVARQSRGEVVAGVGLSNGKQAPDFEAKDGDGISFKLSDYRGKVVVLDFWGYW
jgi:hypothetical protein